MSKARLSLVIAVLVGAAALIASYVSISLQSQPLLPEQMVYAGIWQSEGGLQMQIFENGRGNYSGSGSTVNNGKVTLENGVLSIRLFGLGPVWRIDEPPQDGVMVLEGIVFYRVSPRRLIESSQ